MGSSYLYGNDQYYRIIITHLCRRRREGGVFPGRNIKLVARKLAVEYVARCAALAKANGNINGGCAAAAAGWRKQEIRRRRRRRRIDYLFSRLRLLAHSNRLVQYSTASNAKKRI